MSTMTSKIGKPRKKPAPKLGRPRTGEAGPGPTELAQIALELFAEKHFASVSIRDIGRAANVNSSMLYYYFKDKEALFRAAIETAIDEAFQLFETFYTSDRHENAADAIGEWFDVHVTLHKQLRNVIKISLDCKGVIGVSDAEEPIQRFYRHENEILQKLIREGMRDGIFRKVDPSAVATMISTILDGVLARSFFLSDFDMPRTVREAKDALWQHLGYSTPSKTNHREARKSANGRRHP
ncbi:MAG: TetR/AcrR family transcriptional regulator [Proteobacteria bacterium]|nr:TetR/AcrR family transcriptional regulator [Pseudomonadota bacterium]